MLFTSTTFVLFFLPLLLLCYFVVPQKFVGMRNFVLLTFSICFYGWGGIRYLGLLAISIVVNYIGGILLGTLTSKSVKRTVLVLNLAANLGLLGVFKYAGFAASTLVSLGVPISVPNIALPIGISFFTFQGLSYVVDVYRADAAVQKNPLNVALYISLFPQLVAGPIVRYTDVEREISKRSHTLENFSAGVVRFMLGFGKKMILANPMGEVADKIFGQSGTELLTTPVAWIGAVAYAFQIYFDFSAYSDMAIGLGKMFGFKFNENFNYPYISSSITEFWRRWHISLSTWFRDYVYIPLGGNRCSVPKHIFNLCVVWFLTGMWHGAAWTFILWGIYYGLLLILEKYVFSGLMKHIPRPISHVLTLVLVIIGWVFFRSNTITEATDYLAVMFGAGTFALDQAVYFLRQYAFEFILCLIGIFPVKRVLENFFNSRSENTAVFTVYQILPKVFAVAVFVFAYMKLISGSFNPFIYFQF